MARITDAFKCDSCGKISETEMMQIRQTNTRFELKDEYIPTYDNVRTVCCESCATTELVKWYAEVLKRKAQEKSKDTSNG